MTLKEKEKLLGTDLIKLHINKLKKKQVKTETL